MRLICISSLMLLAAVTLRAEDQPNSPQAGSLTGQFIYDGDPPVAKEVVKAGIVIRDESLVVDMKSAGIRNVVVMLDMKVDGKPPEPVYPAGFLPPTEATLTSTRDRFEPHVLWVRCGQKLNLANPSGVGHNVKADLFANEPLNELVMASSSSQVEIPRPERIPVWVSDSIFPWMKACLVVTDHPFVAISDAQGKFKIDHLPPGEWTFRVWQERSGFVEKVDCAQVAGPWRKGRFSITVKPGENDLGVIKVPTTEFPG